MTKITKVAIKTSSGKIKTAPIGKEHKDIAATGQHGFITSGGTFVNREKGGKIATKAGQAKGMQTKFLHSTNLKKGK